MKKIPAQKVPQSAVKPNRLLNAYLNGLVFVSIPEKISNVIIREIVLFVKEFTSL